MEDLSHSLLSDRGQDSKMLLNDLAAGNLEVQMCCAFKKWVRI